MEVLVRMDNFISKKTLTKMLLQYLPFCGWSYIIPFLLFHSSILRLRLVGPDMDRYITEVATSMTAGRSITNINIQNHRYTDTQIVYIYTASITHLYWPEQM